MRVDLARLERIDQRIREILEEWGLNITPVDFEIVPTQRMFEVMAYGLPVNFKHWSHGRDYERMRTIYEHSGSGLPYEMVLNTSPPKAFLMENNSFALQVLVIGHVYAHVDFFRTNVNFEKLPRDINIQAYEAAKRFDRFEHLYGLSALEDLCDAGLALKMNIDPESNRRESREEQIERVYNEANDHSEYRDDDFLKLFPVKKKKKPSLRELHSKTPLEPDRDVLGYIIENSPKPLNDKEKDVLSVIRSQGRHLYPQLRTKVMNEGWASYWHEKLMRRLFQERSLTAEEHGTFAHYHSAVLAPNPFQINPYYLGKKMFEDIKERWDKGMFGKEWKECEDLWERDNWNKELGQGTEKIFGIRKLYSDRMFIEHFLTNDLIHELQLYIYEEQILRDGSKELIITESRPEIIRRQLLELHSDGGIPRIIVLNGNYNNNRELYLQHLFEGVPLDKEYLKRTLEHIYFLWGRSVHLESVKVIEDPLKSRGYKIKGVVYCYDGKNHIESDMKGARTLY